MPLIACPNCAAKLNAPEAAAGKRVGCPRCQTPIPVPAADADPGFEVVDEEEAALPKPATKPAKAVPAKAVAVKPAPRDDGEAEEKPKARKPTRVDDDDEEDDDRPRKKKAAGKSKSKLPFILLGCGGFAFLGIVGILVLGYYLSESTTDRNKNGGLGPNGGQGWNPPNAAANAKPVTPPPAGRGPAGWVDFNDPKGNFTVSFPVPPTAVDAEGIVDANFGLMGNMMTAAVKAEARTEAVKIMRDIAAYRYTAAALGRAYAITVQTMPAGPDGVTDAKAAIDTATGSYLNAMKTLGGRQTNFEDKPTAFGRTVNVTLVTPTGKGQIMRYMMFGQTLILLTVEGDSKIHHQDVRAIGFFDSFSTNLKP